MKKIINGKTYNTKNATLIGEWSTSGIGTCDFRYCKEGLYLSRLGQYFIAGIGGALTQYGISCGGNHITGCSNIKLLSKEEAREWAEENLTAEEYLNIFEEIEG